MLKVARFVTELVSSKVGSVATLAGFIATALIRAASHLAFVSTTPGTDGVIEDENPQAGTREAQPHRCYDFDGSNDLVATTSHPLNGHTGDFTIAAWVYLDADGTFPMLVSSNSGNFFDFRFWSNSRRLEVQSHVGISYSLISPNAMPLSTWAHVVVKFESATNTFTLVENGVAAIDGDAGAGTIDFGSTLSLGARQGANGLDGKLFDVRIYDSALTESQILELFTEGVDALPNISTVAHYKCDDQHPTLAFDSSGNGNHGTKTSINAAVGEFHYEGTDVPWSWENEVGFSEDGYFTSTSGGWNNVYIRSLQSFNGDGYVEWIDSGQYNWIVGLDNNGSASVTYSNIDFAIYHGGSPNYEIYENATGAINTSASRQTGAILRVERLGNEVRYSKNGEVFYTSLIEANASQYYAVAASTNNGRNLRGFRINGELVKAGVINNAVSFRTSRDESDTANDVYGGALQYTGPAPRNTQAINANCGDFDGVDDYVDCGNATSLQIADNLTVFCRASNDNALVSEDERLVVKYGTDGANREWALAIGTGEKLQLNIGTNSGTSFATIDTDRVLTDLTSIRSYGFTFENGSVKLYIDGVEEAATLVSGTIPSTLLETGQPVTIGAIPNSTPIRVWDGRIWDTRIYEGSSTVLTPAQMLELHNQTASEFDGQALQGHWPLSEGAGTVIHDVSGNANHGTATNISEASFWGSSQDVYHYNLAKGFDKVAYFDGVDDYVQVRTNGVIEEDDEWEIEAKVMLPDVSREVNILSQYRGLVNATESYFLFYHDSANTKWRLFLQESGDGSTFPDVSIYSIATVEAFRWYTVKATRVGNVFSLYVDGVLQGTHDDGANVRNVIGNGGGAGALIGGRSSGAAWWNPPTVFSQMYLADWKVTKNGVITYDISFAGTTSNPEGVAVDSVNGSLDADRIIPSIDGASAVGRSAPSHPAGPYHNGAESDLDFTGGKLIENHFYTRENLVSNPEQIDNVSWQKNALTVVANDAEAPDGTQTADLIYPSSTGINSRIIELITLEAGETYTVSVFAKSAGFDWLRITTPQAANSADNMSFNVVTGELGTTGANGTARIEDVGNGWYRCSVTGPADGSSDYVNIILADSDNSSTSTVNGTDGGQLWGIKVAQGSEPTAYQPVSFDPSLDSSYSFGDALVNPHFKKVTLKNGTAYRESHFYSADRPLLGTDLNLAEGFVE